MKILILVSREGAWRLIKGIELQKRTDIALIIIYLTIGTLQKWSGINQFTIRDRLMSRW
jgi:hypothetical protein